MTLPLRLGVVYDFRNPPDSGIDNPRLYAEILDEGGSVAQGWRNGLSYDLHEPEWQNGAEAASLFLLMNCLLMN